VSLLNDILEKTQITLEERIRQISRPKMRREAERRVPQRPPHRFTEALLGSGLSVIAEVKKRSPSKGLLTDTFDPVAIARSYHSGGAAALSVLTEPHYFEGDLAFLDAIDDAVEVPLLRKDFILDSYQLHEAVLHSASAVLLIAAALPTSKLSDLLLECEQLRLEALVEVHTATELEQALFAGARIIGINNRDLKTFDTTIQTSLELSALIPQDRLSVSESGIHSREDLVRLLEAGFDGVLIGEWLMRQENRSQALQNVLRSLNAASPTRDTSPPPALSGGAGLTQHEMEGE
jgi:indole-3-glycerol phosphate synthase